MVSNIGSSGLDGVSIALGDCDAFFETVQLPAGVPPGATIPHTVLGHLNGEPDQIVLSFLAEFLQLPNPTLRLTPDFQPLGSPTYTVKLLLDGDLVFEQSGAAGPAAQFPAPAR